MNQFTKGKSENEEELCELEEYLFKMQMIASKLVSIDEKIKTHLNQFQELEEVEVKQFFSLFIIILSLSIIIFSLSVITFSPSKIVSPVFLSPFHFLLRQERSNDPDKFLNRGGRMLKDEALKKKLLHSLPKVDHLHLNFGPFKHLL